MEYDDYDQKSGQIRNLASSPPEQFIDHMSNVHSTLGSAAPNIAPHIQSTASTAVQYLNSKLPHTGGALPQDPNLKPSKQQTKQWLNLYSTVNNPTSVLEHVKNGTVNSSQVQALQTVYPGLLAEMKMKVAEHLGSMKMKGETLPYAKRVALSKFLGEPVDSTMTPQSMQAIMRANAGTQTPQTQQAGGPKKASGVELNQINKVNKIYQNPAQARQLK